MDNNTAEIGQAFLGCILKQSELIHTAITLITPGDFCDMRNREIYEYMLEQKEKFDLTTLTTDKFHEPDQQFYLNECVGLAISSDMMSEYAKILKEKSIKTKISVSALATQMWYIKLPVAECLEKIRAELDYITNCQSHTDCFDLKNEFSLTLKDLEDKRFQQEFDLPTGFYDLDNLIGGLYKQELVIVGARPACGKSSFLITLAHNLAKKGKKVLLFSLEMSKREILLRLLSSQAKVLHTRLRLPKFLTQKDWNNIVNANGKLRELPLTILDGDFGVSEMSAEIERYKPDVILVDFLQHLKFGVDELKNFALFLSLATRNLKVLAKRYNISVVAASQLNRDVEKRATKNPQLSDLKSSGGIEENGDLVILLNWYYKNHPEKNPKTGSDWTDIEKKRISINIEKNRHGETGKIDLLFNAEYTLFSNLERGSMDIGYGGGQ